MNPDVTMLTPYRYQSSPEMTGAQDSALNWYSARLARELEEVGVKVTVIGPRPNRTPATWHDGRVHVCSVFDRGFAKAPIRAYRQLLRTKCNLLHVQHELFAFGGLAGALMLPPVLAALQRRAIPILTTIHGVIPLSEVSDDFVRANRIPGNAALARLFWRGLIRTLARHSTRVHVHEQFLRELLNSGIWPA